jgi:hypothetical protein
MISRKKESQKKDYLDLSAKPTLAKWATILISVVYAAGLLVALT